MGNFNINSPEIHVPLNPRVPKPFTITSSKEMGTFSVSSAKLEMFCGTGLARTAVNPKRDNSRMTAFVWKEIIYQ